MQDPDKSHQQENPHADRFSIGYAAPPPPVLHVEAVEGGFLVHASVGGSNRRGIAASIPKLIKLAREWSGHALPYTVTAKAKEPGS